jgi:hypothetical protein
LERYRSEKGKVQIPLKASYELLSALVDEVGRALEQQEFKNALSSRNDSIAAHGLKPVTEEVATKRKEAIKPLLEKVVPRLSNLLNEAKFPCLKP